MAVEAGLLEPVLNAPMLLLDRIIPPTAGDPMLAVILHAVHALLVKHFQDALV